MGYRRNHLEIVSIGTNLHLFRRCHLQGVESLYHVLLSFSLSTSIKYIQTIYQVKFRICHMSLVLYRGGIVGHLYHEKAVAVCSCAPTCTYALAYGRGRAFRRRTREVKAFIYRHFGCVDIGKGIGIPLRYYCTAVSWQKIEP